MAKPFAHAIQRKKHQQQVVQDVNRKLEELEKEFGKTAEKMEKGELDLEDLAWESFGGESPKSDD